jgi:hypothetical protein
VIRTWREILGCGLVAVLFLAGCAAPWELTLSSNGALESSVTDRQWRALAKQYPGEMQGKRALPLERILWESGVAAVDQVTIGDQAFDWLNVYESSWLLQNGRCQVGDDTLPAGRIAVEVPAEIADVQASLLDVAPTLSANLGLAAPADSEGRLLVNTQEARAVLVILDGLGFRRYQQARAEGQMPFLGSLGQPLVALTVYPSTTKVATAAMITGASPMRNGVSERGPRSTESETIFDVVAGAGRSGVAVEGSDLAFNLRNAQIILSGDRDDNGSTDDNTLQNALKVMSDDMPDFLSVHFHGIDNAGHTFGPLTAEEKAKLDEVDEHMRLLVEALPPSTLLLVLADHGMHAVREEERLGNHGSLLADDMLIPLWIAHR